MKQGDLEVSPETWGAQKRKMTQENGPKALSHTLCILVPQAITWAEHTAAVDHLNRQTLPSQRSSIVWPTEELGIEELRTPECWLENDPKL